MFDSLASHLDMLGLHVEVLRIESQGFVLNYTPGPATWNKSHLSILEPVVWRPDSPMQLTYRLPVSLKVNTIPRFYLESLQPLEKFALIFYSSVEEQGSVWQLALDADFCLHMKSTLPGTQSAVAENCFLFQALKQSYRSHLSVWLVLSHDFQASTSGRAAWPFLFRKALLEVQPVPLPCPQFQLS